MKNINKYYKDDREFFKLAIQNDLRMAFRFINQEEEEKALKKLEEAIKCLKKEIAIINKG